MNDERRLPVIVGRSSSHFTRITRIFAHELSVPHAFRVAADLLSTRPADYANHPALRLPILESVSGSWFGSMAICRELSRLATRPRYIVWPEALSTAMLSNAQELILQGMATEVALVMHGLNGAPADHLNSAGKQAEHPYQHKLGQSLDYTLAWLETHVDAVLAALPTTRELSFLEVSLFCFITHLPFRDVRSIAGLGRLQDFCTRFAERDSALQTVYRFDV